MCLVEEKIGKCEIIAINMVYGVLSMIKEKKTILLNLIQ